MRLNTIKPAPGLQAQPPARGSRRVGRPGQDLRPWRQGPARAQGRLPQGRLRGRPDAAAASHAQGRLPFGHEGVARRSAPRRARQRHRRRRDRPRRAEGGRRRPQYSPSQAKVVLSGEIKKAVKLKGIGATKGAKAAIKGRRQHRGLIDPSPRQQRRRTTERHDGIDQVPRWQLLQAIRQRLSATPRASAEIRGRLLFLIGALIVYRIGTFIPVPGIDPAKRRAVLPGPAGTILGIVNMFSGGALERLSIFAMGVMPYISASIIMQMMSMVVSAADGVPQGRRVRPAQDDPDHALRHRRPRHLPVARRGDRAAERRHGERRRLAVPVHRDDHHDHRHDVPDVARRADHRARHRQRHLDDHPRRHHRRPAGRRSAARSSRSTPARCPAAVRRCC